MTVYRDTAEAAAALGGTGCAVTWGVFDGVHRGHRAILDALREEADRAGVPALGILLGWHPVTFLRGIEIPRISHPEQRERRMLEVGVDALLRLEFDATLARTSAEGFVRDLLVDRLGVRAIVLGEGGRFGADREGDLRLLRRLRRECGIAVRGVPPVEVDGERASSTAVRRALAAGDVGRAERILGSPFTLYGRVVSGAGRGRTIGIPTANLDTGGQMLPAAGVYAGRLAAGGPEGALAVINVGVRPTFGDRTEPVCEVHLPDREVDLAGKRIEVTFRRRIREERRFDSAAALRDQIAADIAAARALP